MGGDFKIKNSRLHPSEVRPEPYAWIRLRFLFTVTYINRIFRTAHGARTRYIAVKGRPLNQFALGSVLVMAGFHHANTTTRAYYTAPAPAHLPCDAIFRLGAPVQYYFLPHHQRFKELQ